MESIFFKSGFLGTRAPLFMDITTLIVALLPLLLGIAISFAKKGNYKRHALFQIFIYIVSVVVVAYFEIGVRLAGGYKGLLDGSSVSHNYLLIVLITHIIIATVTLIVWSYIVIKSYIDYNKRLPGVKSSAHKKLGVKTFILIFLTAFSGIWVYLLLFVY